MKRSVRKTNISEFFKRKFKIRIFKIEKKLSRLSLLFVLVQLSFGIFIIFESRSVIKGDYIPFIKLTLRDIFELNFGTVYPSDFIKYTKELTSSIFFDKKLPRLDLNINYKNLAGLDCERKRISSLEQGETFECSNNRWFKGELLSKNKNFKIKLRPKGDREIHRENLKEMSFKIDIKGDKRYKGMEEFALQIPTIRNYTMELFSSRLLREENIIAPRNLYVRIYLNGEYIGIRHLEESFSKEIIESTGNRYGPIFSLNEDISSWYYNSYFDLSDKKYWSSINNSITKEALVILERTRFDSKITTKFYNLDLWGKYFAITDALNVMHGALPKSVKYYANPVNGLIEPVFYDGHYNSKHLHNMRISDFYHQDLIPDCDYWRQCRTRESDILEKSFYQSFLGTSSNPNYDFYNSYLDNLERLTSEEYINSKMIPLWESLSKERGSIYKEFWGVDSGYREMRFPHIESFKNFKNRLSKIKEDVYLARNMNPKFSVSENLKKIIVSNQISRLPQTIYFQCNSQQSNPIVLIRNNPVIFDYSGLSNCNLNDIYYSLDNFKSIKNVNNGYITDYDLESIISNPKIYASVNANANKKSKISFSKGLTKIDRPVLLENKKVVIDSGADICLEKNAYIHIKNSNIEIAGNNINPVIIRSCSFKNIQNFSDGIIFESSQINIQNLKLLNLSSPKLPMRNLYGGINIINSQAKIKNLNIKNITSEDSINFVNSDIKATNIYISKSFSDGIDSDNSKISIDQIICNDIGNDCFDLSFSNSKVKNLIATKVGDKVVSLGESSILDLNLINIIDSEIGIVSKDNSRLFVENFIYESLALPIAAYIKKDEFGSPQITINKISKKINNNYLLSNDAKLTIGGTVFNSILSSKEVQNQLYGEKFGIKTKRR